MNIDELLSILGNLPPISNGPVKMIELLKNEQTDTKDIIEILKFSPGLSSSILRIANSAFYNFRGQIASINDIVEKLGVDQLYRLTTSVEFSAILNHPVRGFELTSDELVLHAMIVAIIAEEISAAINYEDKDGAFSAGLFHDIGKMIMEGYVKFDFRMMTKSGLEEESFDKRERELLGIDHAELGGIVLEIWGFPQKLVIPVRWHHSPEAKVFEYQPIVDIIHISDHLSRSSGIGLGYEGLQYHLSKPAVKRLKLKTSQMERILSGAMTRFDVILKRFNS